METHDFSELDASKILNNIEMLLKVQGKTKYQMAQQVEIPRSSIQNWRSGKIFPSADKLYKIAKYLNTSVEYLLTGMEENFNTPDHQLYKAIQNLSVENRRLITELITRLK